MTSFFRIVSSEWLKRRRSLTTWLVVGGAAFVPAIIVLGRLRRLAALPAIYANAEFWTVLWRQSWESMALLILPLSVMMIVSLITQIEDRNNAWKQVHAAPVTLPVIFLSKLTVVLILCGALVMLHTAALYAAGVGPAWLLSDVSMPAQRFPLEAFVLRGFEFLLDAAPIVAFQYALALRFRTFVAPLAIGMAFWILSIGTISWRYNFLIPYSYAGLDYLAVEYHRPSVAATHARLIAAGCFLVFTMAGYAAYASRRDKG